MPKRQESKNIFWQSLKKRLPRSIKWKLQEANYKPYNLKYVKYGERGNKYQREDEG